jgi:hypothetical protein
MSTLVNRVVQGAVFGLSQLLQDILRRDGALSDGVAPPREIIAHSLNHADLFRPGKNLAALLPAGPSFYQFENLMHPETSLRIAATLDSGRIGQRGSQFLPHSCFPILAA